MLDRQIYCGIERIRRDGRVSPFGRPDDALALHRAGRSPAAWGLIPKAMARGEVAALADLDPAGAVDALQKLCHDLLACRVGAAPRYFAAADLPQPERDALAILMGQLADVRKIKARERG